MFYIVILLTGVFFKQIIILKLPLEEDHMMFTREDWKTRLAAAQKANNAELIANYQYLLDTYTDSYYESLSAFYTTLPREGDLTLLVLKGHILIEQQLNRFVRMHFPNQKPIENMFKTTHSLICVGRAYSESDNEEIMQLWDSVGHLNSLRNKLAHELSPNSHLELSIEKFLKSSKRFVVFTVSTEEVDNAPLFTELRNAISAVYQKILYLANTQESAYQRYLDSKK
ncbi:hypothetical protein ACPV3O_16900 [Vibrio rotiferianus]|uniref:hypothetical protein n=1 Tax=Vibrio rotiferianus TaxID=190895 RepID=UPI00406A9F73